MIGVRVPEGTADAFAAMARRHHRTTSDEVRRLIDEALAVDAAVPANDPVPLKLVKSG
jgi:plasmid stability protein